MSESKPVRFMKHAAFIVVIIFVLALAVALVLGAAAYYFWWSGPPRDPKCFALDNEDFGLGIRLGDPWDPDAFESAMKANGLDVVRTSHSAGPEYDFFSASWYTANYMLSVHVISDDKTADASLESISLKSFSPGNSPVKEAYRASEAFATCKAIWNQAKDRFPDDYDAASEWASGQYASHVGKAVPQIATGEGLTLGSTEETARQAYGEPFDYVDVARNNWLWYMGNQVYVTFFTDNDQIAMISLHNIGYRHMSTEAKLRTWDRYFMTEEERKARDDWIAEVSKNGDGGESAEESGEEAESEVESEQD